MEIEDQSLGSKELDSQSVSLAELKQLSRWVFTPLFKYKPGFAIGLYLLNVFVTIRALASSALYSWIINFIIGLTLRSHVRLEDALPVVILYSAYEVFFSIVNSTYQIFKNKANQSLSLFIKSSYYQKIIRLDTALLDAKFFEIDQPKAFEQIQNALVFYNQIIGVAGSVTGTLIVSIFLIFYAPIIIPILLIGITPQILLNKKFQPLFKEDSDRTKDIIKSESSISSNIFNREKLLETKANGLVSYIVHRYFSKLNYLNKESINLKDKYYGIKTLIEAGNSIIVISGVIWVITKSIASKTATGSIYFQLNVVKLFQSKINETAILFYQLLASAASIKKIAAIFSLKENIDLPNQQSLASDSSPKLSLKNINLNIPKVDPSIVQDISLNINPGQKIAVIGPANGGKNELVRVLAGLLTPVSGSFLVNDLPFSQIKPSSWYSGLGYMSKSFLFFYSLSIKDNITFGLADSSINEDRLNLAIQMVGLSKYVEGLPQKINQILDPRLKNGTKAPPEVYHRLCLARILYRQPKLAIFNNTSYSFGPQYEFNFFNRTFKHLASSTVIVSTTNIYTVKNANLIIIVKDGCIVESGTHDQLLSTPGIYQAAYAKLKPAAPKPVPQPA